ncbi:MAG TPA: glycosyltransferase [Bacteroidales bacterium]|nr:glycosyltransferase [Bacteroidales bacterium]
MKIKILQLCHKIPYPPVDGGSIAMHQLTDFFFKHGFKTKVVALNTGGKKFSPENIPENYRIKTRFEALNIDTRINPGKAFISLFTGKSYNVSRFYSKAISKRLSQILDQEEFDLVQLEGLYLTPYLPIIRKKSRAKVVYRSHNIEHVIWKGLATKTKNPVLKLYLNHLASRLEKYEVGVIDQFDAICAISPSDMDYFVKNGFTGLSVVIPVMVHEGDNGNLTPTPVQGTVFHLGSMDWRPNQDGVQWFLEKVWPKVLAQAPEMTFFIAGKNMPQRFLKYSGRNNVTVVGEVASASSFMADKHIMVVPLFSGSGMRVKIIEGLAAGKTIISTGLGAEGTGCRHNENILIADNPDEMANLIVACYRKPEWAKAIAANGTTFVKNHFGPDRIHNDLMAFYKELYLT